jgi:hypothetical protein
VDSIEARALAAPTGTWTEFPDKVHIPWSAEGDEQPDGPWGWGRYLAIPENEWHVGMDDPPPGLWEFLAAARTDVLTLAAEVRWLRAALAARPSGPSAGSS